MREWRRANRRQLCGGCNRDVALDDPILVIRIGSVEKIRCARCAGPAPPDLPAAMVTVASALTGIGSVAEILARMRGERKKCES